MKRLLSLIAMVVTAALSWVVYHKFSGSLYPSYDPAFVATVILAAILIHEIGHWVVMEACGVRSFIYVLVLLGGAAPFLSSLDKFESLNWSKDAAISLAGVMGNIVMVLISCVLYGLAILDAEQLRFIARINGSLIFFNLIPISLLDGRRFAHALFNSVPEHLDDRYARVMAVLIFAGAIIVTITTPESFFITPLIVRWGLLNEAEEDDPNGSTSPRAMSKKQQMRWAATYLALMISGMALMGIAYISKH